jgi:D-tyrosyl-tRNA(Tyr) deacylase
VRVVVQRVRQAAVDVAGQTVGSIGAGLLLLVGFADDDTDEVIQWITKKVVGLRIFPDNDGQMNLSVEDVEGELLVVSQFTLYGDVNKGRRPSFVHAAHPDHARKCYDRFVTTLSESGRPVATGEFGAAMDVSLVNWGPVTLIIDR